MEVSGPPIAGVEYGNAWQVDTRNDEGQKAGWLVGYSHSLRVSPLRFMSDDARASGIGVKWFEHQAGDPNGVDKPLSIGRTLSFLVNPGGRFLLEIWRRREERLTIILTQPGDFAAWGEGLHHTWQVLRPSTLLTVRWNPLPEGPTPP